MTSTTGPSSDPARMSAISRPLPCASLRQGGGFTLMELILVLVVISAVLGMCAPFLRGFFASRQTADAAGAILSLTKWARSEAISQGHPCRLNIDTLSGTYWLTVQQSGAFVAVNRDLGRRFQLPEGSVVSLHSDAPGPSPSYIQFYPSGRSDAASIEITGRQGDVYVVTCPSATEPFRVVSPSETQ